MLAVSLWATAAAHAGPLQVRALSAPNLIDHHVIVGRAHCRGATWLLTDAPELIRISVDAHAVVSSPVRGLGQTDKMWGLACLPNNELWTLAAHDVLARLEPDGRLAERIRLDRPRLGVYSAGERILLQQAPTAAGRPLLAAGLPKTLTAFLQWPAPLSQPTASRDEQLTANLVNCGIGAASYVPCWLVNQTRVVISDGSPAHTTVQEFRFVRGGAIDGAVPLWDMALAGSARVWVLASARATPGGRRAGGRLTRSTRRGTDEGSLDVIPAARLILWATDDRCVVLSSTDQLLEVVGP